MRDLDGIAPRLWGAITPQSRALHEAIADLTALAEGGLVAVGRGEDTANRMPAAQDQRGDDVLVGLGLSPRACAADDEPA